MQANKKGPQDKNQTSPTVEPESYHGKTAKTYIIKKF